MINNKRMLDRFLELVQIDSESGNELGMCERLMAELRTIPGAEIRTEASGDFYKTNGYNIIADIPGTLPGEPILLSAHMDTVVPGNGIKPQVRDGVVYSDGTTILAADDKCGITEILEAVESIKEQGKAHRSIEIIFSVGEEQGLYGARSIDTSKLKARQGYIMDTGGAPGKIVACQPGQYSFFVTITGRRSHAGNTPEAGISAIQVAAKAIANMKLLRVDELTTCNIGEIHSQFPTNIVPETLTLKGEARSRDVARLEAQMEHIYKCFEDACAEAGASFEFEKTLKYQAYKMEDDAPVIAEISESLRRLGVEPSIQGAGGGSDANIYNQQGMQCVVLGNGMREGHALTEHLFIAEMDLAAEVLYDVLTH